MERWYINLGGILIALACLLLIWKTIVYEDEISQEPATFVVSHKANQGLHIQKLKLGKDLIVHKNWVY